MTTVIQVEAGSVFGNEFRVVKPLDEGGMGTVYVAEQISTGEERALKVMQPHLVTDMRSRERFLQEARLRARIKSEHVVKVIAAGVDEPTGIPWMAMELLDGENLDTLVRRRVRLSADEVCRIFEHLGHALAAAHAVGIVHRDIKPENIFVASSQRADVPFTVKLLDFGIAKVVRGSMSAATTGTLLGSPLWMAPEQANAGSINASTDVWALGLLAFWMLTGHYYWRSAHQERVTVESLLAEILFAPLEPGSVRAASWGCEDFLPAGMDGWLARCLVRTSDQRFQEAAEAVNALVPVLTEGRLQGTLPVGQAVPRGSEPAPATPDQLLSWPSSRTPSAPAPLPAGLSPRSVDAMELSPTMPVGTTQSPLRRTVNRVLLAVVAGMALFALGLGVMHWVIDSGAPRAGRGASLPRLVADPGGPEAGVATPVVVVVVDAGTGTGTGTRAADAAVRVVRPVAPAGPMHVTPRAAGHAFSRRLEWDVQCAGHARQRRAWSAAPTFASHAVSDQAAGGMGCTDMVGGIGWCCP